MDSNNNTTRVLKNAVSVDGWIAAFDENGEASVHVDVSFMQGFFGEDPKSKVRFKIALNRVAIHVRIGEGSPIKLIRRTVARPQASETAISRETSKTSLSAKGKAAASLSASPTASVEFDAEAGQEREIATEIERSVTRHLESHYSGNKEGEQVWEFRPNPSLCKTLDRKAWPDPDANPRFSVRKANEKPGEKPMVIVEVRCRRQDIEIVDLELKDPKQQSRFNLKKNNQKNLAAAEQIIKDELSRAGFLETPDISEPYSELLIADRFIFEDD